MAFQTCHLCPFRPIANSPGRDCLGLSPGLVTLADEIWSPGGKDGRGFLYNACDVITESSFKRIQALLHRRMV